MQNGYKKRRIWCCKKLMRKKLSAKSDRKMEFFTFISVNFSAYNFFWGKFFWIFQRIQTQHPILRFMIPIPNFLQKKYFFANIITYC